MPRRWQKLHVVLILLAVVTPYAVVAGGIYLVQTLAPDQGFLLWLPMLFGVASGAAFLARLPDNRGLLPGFIALYVFAMAVLMFFWTFDCLAMMFGKAL